MKRHVLLCFALFPIALLAQEKIHEQVIGWKGNRIELHTLSDKARQLSCLFLLKNDSLKGFLLGDKNIPIQQFNVLRQPDEQLLGGFIKESKIYVFLNNKDSGGIHNWTFDMLTGNGIENFIPFELKKERMIDRISCGDHFLYFTINKKASEFIIYDFHDESRFDTLHYHFEENIWKHLTKYNGGFGREMNVGKVDMEGECSVDIAQTPNKIYLVNDTMYLVMNMDAGITNVFSFDTRNKKVNFRKIDHHSLGQPDASETYSDNSFLLKGKLYFVSATADTLNMQIINFADGQILKKYLVGKKDEISFKNTPIIQEGGGTIYSMNTTRELGKTRQLLRKMSNGEAVIAASEDSGRIVLTVGSYQEVSSGGGGGMWMTGAGGASTMIFVPTGAFYRNTWKKSARFKALLDDGTLEHLDGDIQPSINERIENYTEGITIPPEGENLFKNNGKYIYAYYDKKERKLVLVDF